MLLLKHIIHSAVSGKLAFKQLTVGWLLKHYWQIDFTVVLVFKGTPLILVLQVNIDYNVENVMHILL